MEIRRSGQDDHLTLGLGDQFPSSAPQPPAPAPSPPHPKDAEERSRQAPGRQAQKAGCRNSRHPRSQGQSLAPSGSGGQASGRLLNTRSRAPRSQRGKKRASKTFSERQKSGKNRCRHQQLGCNPSAILADQAAPGRLPARSSARPSVIQPVACSRKLWGLAETCWEELAKPGRRFQEGKRLQAKPESKRI